MDKNNLKETWATYEVNLIASEVYELISSQGFNVALFKNQGTGSIVYADLNPNVSDTKYECRMYDNTWGVISRNYICHNLYILSAGTCRITVHLLTTKNPAILLSDMIVTGGGGVATLVDVNSLPGVNISSISSTILAGMDKLPGGDNNIGNVDIVSIPNTILAGMDKLPGGTNNIGKVDVANLPNGVLASMDKLPGGTNNIGKVDVANFPANTLAGMSELPTGTNKIGKVDVDTLHVDFYPSYIIYEYNIPMPSANIEYSQALPSGCKKYTYSLQENDTEYRTAFTAGCVGGTNPTPPYIKHPAGGGDSEDRLALYGKTLYFACPVAGKTMQIRCFA